MQACRNACSYAYHVGESQVFIFSCVIIFAAINQSDPKLLSAEAFSYFDSHYPSYLRIAVRSSLFLWVVYNITWYGGLYQNLALQSMIVWCAIHMHDLWVCVCVVIFCFFKRNFFMKFVSHIYLPHASFIFIFLFLILFRNLSRILKRHSFSCVHCSCLSLMLHIHCNKRMTERTPGFWTFCASITAKRSGWPAKKKITWYIMLHWKMYRRNKATSLWSTTAKLLSLLFSLMKYTPPTSSLISLGFCKHFPSHIRNMLVQNIFQPPCTPHWNPWRTQYASRWRQ